MNIIALPEQNSGLVLFKGVDYFFNVLALPNFAAALVVALVGLAVFFMERPGRVRALFFCIAAIMCIWQFSRGFAISTRDPGLSLLWFRIGFFWMPVGVAAFYHCLMSMIDLQNERRSIIVTNWIVAPLLILAAVITSEDIAALRMMRFGPEPAYGYLGYVCLAWIQLLSLLAFTDIYRKMARAEPGSAYRNRLRYVWFAALALYPASSDLFVAAGINLYPLSPFAFVAFMLIILVLIYRYGLTDIAHGLGTDHLIRAMNQAIMIVDPNGLIKSPNPACARLFQSSVSELRRLMISDLLGPSAHIHRLMKLANSENNTIEIERQQPGAITTQVLSMTLGQVKDKREQVSAVVCMFRDITTEKHETQRRKNAFLTDLLTKLPNRMAFHEVLSRDIERIDHREEACAILIIGIDRFRLINEELSQAFGDRVLCDIADRLDSLTPSDALVARIAGDEFGIVYTGQVDVGFLHQNAQQILDGIHGKMTLDGQLLHLSVSIGAAMTNDSITNADDLMRHAIRAMYHAKTKGGGCFELLEDLNNDTGLIQLESDIRSGLQRNEFIPYYQPIVDMRSHAVVGFEALVRWKKADGTVVPPFEFLDFAEDLGLMEKIGEQMRRVVMGDVARFVGERAQEPIYVSINISQSEFESEQLLKSLARTMKDNQITPDSIRIELVERMVSLDPENSRMQELVSLGYGLYIDDFGTGYSSLSRLQGLPLEVLKIDRSFVMAMLGSGQGESLVKIIIQLALSLNLNVIAEGVSSEAEEKHLLSLGCHFSQGFYYSPPVPFEQAIAMLGDVITPNPDN